jgi:3-deoxy-D-manno-octulosonic-acid transferase
MVQSWGLPGVTAAFAPLDLNGPLARVLKTWQPKLLLTVEGEIYPRRFAACAKAGIPLALIGARMSERSYQGWKELQPVMARALGLVAMASAQDAASARRLVALGLPQDRLHPVCDLKAVAIRRLPAPSLPLQDTRTRWLLAASTHEGEEAAVLDAFLAARARFDHLILAPRHPRRADEVAALVTARGLSLARRSSGVMPGAEAVFLADTMGEMDLWYARAGACFVGGSLAPRGGHSPWEPARFGCAILHGPSVSNFAAAYGALAAAGGALSADTSESLAVALQGLDADHQAALSEACAQSLRTSDDGAGLIHELLTLMRG